MKNQTKPNILLACKHRVRGGGQEKNYMQIARHFQDKYNFSFLLAGGFIDDDMRSIGNVYIFPGKGNWILSPIDFIYYIYVILREKIDLVHAHHRYAAFLGSIIRKAMGFKLITTAHNVFPDKSSISLFGDQIIAVSSAVKEWLINECNVSENNITVIHNGIPTPVHWNTDKLNILKSQLIPNNTQHILLTIGRLLPQKNYSLLLNSLSKLEISDWHLLIVGEGDEENMLKELVKKLKLNNKVSFLGFRTDVEGLLQLSDLYVMSSRWEGLPYVLVEGLANSLPAVATNVGGVKEAVLDNQTGLVVEPDSESAIIEAITSLLSDPKRLSVMASQCNKQFKDCFLDERMFYETEKCYRLLLK